QLTAFRTRGAKTHTVNNVIQTGFQQLQQVFTGSTFTARGFGVVATELLLKNAIHTANFLLFTQLGAVVGQTAATGAVLTRCGLHVALTVECANPTLQKQICPFATRQLTFWSKISSHVSVSSTQTRRFFGGRHPL